MTIEETRKQRRKIANKIKNAKRNKIITWSIVGFALLTVIFMLGTSKGNTLMHNMLPNVNTPMDHIAKGKLRDKMNSADLSKQDSNRAISVIDNTNMSRITKAAKDPSTAATLYSMYSGKDKTSSRDVINVIYSDKRLNQLRDDLYNNRWNKVYKEYDRLNDEGIIDEVLTKSEASTSNSAIKMQLKARKMYNEAILEAQQQEN